MTILVADVLARTDDMLNDVDRTRWPAAERIRYMNDALDAILIRRPAAFANRVVHDLAAGTAQALPAGGVQFLDCVRNIAANGVTPGAPIRRTDRQLLDDSDPTWHTGKPKATIKHYVFDDRAPTLFYVYPPAIAGTKVELLQAALPAQAVETDEPAADAALPVGREYREAVINYVCYRAKAKDSEYANAGEAGAYYQAFEASLGVKTNADVNASPNQPGNSV